MMSLKPRSSLAGKFADSLVRNPRGGDRHNHLDEGRFISLMRLFPPGKNADSTPSR